MSLVEADVPDDAAAVVEAVALPNIAMLDDHSAPRSSVSAGGTERQITGKSGKPKSTIAHRLRLPRRGNCSSEGECCDCHCRGLAKEHLRLLLYCADPDNPGADAR